MKTAALSGLIISVVIGYNFGMALLSFTDNYSGSIYAGITATMAGWLLTGLIFWPK